MKKIFCTKCDAAIVLGRDKMASAIQNDDGKLCVICPSCGRQLNLRLKTNSSTKSTERKDKPLASITIIENIFGYKQNFLLYEGANCIGRRNKDTKTDIAIITADPSMDRHHCMIICKTNSKGVTKYYLQDNDSMTGTFLLGREIPLREKAILHSGDIITLGATTIIFNDKVEDNNESQVILQDTHK